MNRYSLSAFFSFSFGFSLLVSFSASWSSHLFNFRWEHDGAGNPGGQHAAPGHSALAAPPTATGHGAAAAVQAPGQGATELGRVAAEVANAELRSPLCTTLRRGSARVRTVEHLLSTMETIGVDNCHVEVSGGGEVRHPFVAWLLLMCVSVTALQQRMLQHNVFPIYVNYSSMTDSFV
ncbi:hypothetical protein GUJ93_ZPchr0013g35997 [Zizania palustris]|uniref:UDP-3-O-acyl-N-acetylglucosamine deacetylase n=1 Tax=Zizania palustris TaxID=103762 RepID=A0A8J6BWH4_ZIZPA|nr:hypothetical protein GUJ93_ZPchr0013g35997 [Zizania palustris]